MKKITVIDDDYASEILVEHLVCRGYDAHRIKSASAAIQAMDEVLNADLIILDIIMEHPQNCQISSISGDRMTGMYIFRIIRERQPTLPIIVLTASRDRELTDILTQEPHTWFMPKWSTFSLQEIVEVINRAIGGLGESSPPRSFIVHGHDVAEKLALKNYLQNTLGWPEPLILHEQPNLGKTIIEKLEDYIPQVDIVFILLTPDDKVASGDKTNEEKRRARQNVIFELGFFLGVFGRTSGRVILLYKGPLDLPSDLSGVIYIDISNGVESAGEIIRREAANVS